ncbi:hypothetical protein N0K21_00575 [Yersinia aleksiciae]|uniref:hypothetical protein n=1 Tax=Yersinia aleksiciae TaxID=263819 RepID=UPI001427BF4E|nr:hypothetical protein [Yersinia aleksiciae]NIK99877.1 hypothetical protein [Yersinia aleksiciae]WQC71036.1 hypothetical protein N0K21_00575 [Yersinia aleksiciae]
MFAKTVPVNITTGLNTSYSIKLKNDLTLHAKKYQGFANVTFDRNPLVKDSYGEKYPSGGLRMLRINARVPDSADELFKGTLELVIESQA